jgi:hypothetical protein
MPLNTLMNDWIVSLRMVWSAKSYQSMLGPPNNQTVYRFIFRAYYIDTGIFELLGKRFNISPLATEVMHVQAQLQKRDLEGGRLSKKGA